MKTTHQKSYIVIASYPNSPFEIGDIITWDGIVWGMNEPQRFTRNPENHPAIFKLIPQC